MKVRVEKGNVVLDVEDYELQHYLSLGYNQTDEFGNIIAEAIPTDLGKLRALYIEQKKKIEELEAAIAKLTANKETAKKKPTNKSKAE